MGGAVRPVARAVQQVVGGASKAANALVGNKPEAPAAAAAAPAPEAAKPVERRASANEEMMGARMRGARRRGRQLLSDARLNPAQGETLGGGNNL